MTRIIFLPSHNSSLLLSLYSSSNAQNHRKRFQLQLEFSRKYLFICSDLLFLRFNKIVLSDQYNIWAICGTRSLLQEYSSISNNTMKSILSMSALIFFFPPQIMNSVYEKPWATSLKLVTFSTGCWAKLLQRDLSTQLIL